MLFENSEVEFLKIHPGSSRILNRLSVKVEGFNASSCQPRLQHIKKTASSLPRHYFLEEDQLQSPPDVGTRDWWGKNGTLQRNHDPRNKSFLREQPTTQNFVFNFVCSGCIFRGNRKSRGLRGSWLELCRVRRHKPVFHAAARSTSQRNFNKRFRTAGAI